MKEKVKIKLEDKIISVFPNSTIHDLIKKFDTKQDDVIAVKVNNIIADFDTKVQESDVVDFLYANDSDGNKIYKSGLKFVLIKAVEELYKGLATVTFEHSIDKGICFTIFGNCSFDQKSIGQIKERMNKIITKDYLFEKVNVLKKDAIEYFKRIGCPEKASNVQNISNNFAVLYKLENSYNYFYTDMPHSTACLKYFDIVYIEDNRFVLLFPVEGQDVVVPTYHHYPLNMKAFSDYQKWICSLNISTVGDVNNLVATGKIADFIHTNELYLQKNILEEARKISDNPNIKFILISGPSSSGKTTTSKKLALALKTFGKSILAISLDDYYYSRNQLPEKVAKSKDYESIDSINIELLNENINNLMNMEEVVLPAYDFNDKRQDYNSKPVSIDENTIIILEGIHAFNNKILSEVNSKYKYRMYVSPFEPLTIDRHNHLSTLDLRLLRRIVRDNKFRGVSAEETIKSWQRVRDGEEKNIFAYMDNVDSVLNTSLIYEIGIMKVYAEPLLYSVPVTSKAYEEAKRLIHFLKIFYPIPSEYVDKTSLLREFIGGSIYK